MNPNQQNMYRKTPNMLYKQQQQQLYRNNFDPQLHAFSPPLEDFYRRDGPPRGRPKRVEGSLPARGRPRRNSQENSSPLNPSPSQNQNQQMMMPQDFHPQYYQNMQYGDMNMSINPGQIYSQKAK